MYIRLWYIRTHLIKTISLSIITSFWVFYVFKFNKFLNNFCVPIVTDFQEIIWGLVVILFTKNEWAEVGVAENKVGLAIIDFEI